jgi:5-methylcytosine-specific restriction endonuclease McrA
MHYQHPYMLLEILCKKCRTRRPRRDFKRYPKGAWSRVCNQCYISPKEAEIKRHQPMRDKRAALLSQGKMDCTACGKVKPLKEFPSQGRNHICNKCNARTSRVRYRSQTVERRRMERNKCWASMIKDPAVKLRYALRRRMTTALRRAMACKTESSARVMNYIGCSVAELRAYIESQFEPGMTWQNHGVHGWHIDHVFPLCRFDLTNETDKHKAWHYTNLRPLWARKNLSKNARAPALHQPQLLGV